MQKCMQKCPVFVFLAPQGHPEATQLCELKAFSDISEQTGASMVLVNAGAWDDLPPIAIEHLGVDRGGSKRDWMARVVDRVRRILARGAPGLSVSVQLAASALITEPRVGTRFFAKQAQERIVRLGLRWVGADYCTLLVPRSDYLDCVAQECVDESLVLHGSGERIRTDSGREGIISAAIESGEPVVVRNVREGRFRSRYIECYRGTASELVVPVRVPAGVFEPPVSIAALNFESQKEAHFDPYRVAQAELLASHVSLAYSQSAQQVGLLEHRAIAALDQPLRAIRDSLSSGSDQSGYTHMLDLALVQGVLREMSADGELVVALVRGNLVMGLRGRTARLDRAWLGTEVACTNREMSFFSVDRRRSVRHGIKWLSERAVGVVPVRSPGAQPLAALVIGYPRDAAEVADDTLLLATHLADQASRAHARCEGVPSYPDSYRVADEVPRLTLNLEDAFMQQHLVDYTDHVRRHSAIALEEERGSLYELLPTLITREGWPAFNPNQQILSDDVNQVVAPPRKYAPERLRWLIRELGNPANSVEPADMAFIVIGDSTTDIDMAKNLDKAGVSVRAFIRQQGDSKIPYIHKCRSWAEVTERVRDYVCEPPGGRPVGRVRYVLVDMDGTLIVPSGISMSTTADEPVAWEDDRERGLVRATARYVEHLKDRMDRSGNHEVAATELLGRIKGLYRLGSRFPPFRSAGDSEYWAFAVLLVITGLLDEEDGFGDHPGTNLEADPEEIRSWIDFARRQLPNFEESGASESIRERLTDHIRLVEQRAQERLYSIVPEFRRAQAAVFEEFVEQGTFGLNRHVVEAINLCADAQWAPIGYTDLPAATFGLILDPSFKTWPQSASALVYRKVGLKTE